MKSVRFTDCTTALVAAESLKSVTLTQELLKQHTAGYKSEKVGQDMVTKMMSARSEKFDSQHTVSTACTQTGMASQADSSAGTLKSQSLDSGPNMRSSEGSEDLQVDVSHPSPESKWLARKAAKKAAREKKGVRYGDLLRKQTQVAAQTVIPCDEKHPKIDREYLQKYNQMFLNDCPRLVPRGQKLDPIESCSCSSADDSEDMRIMRVRNKFLTADSLPRISDCSGTLDSLPSLGAVNTHESLPALPDGSYMSDSDESDME